MLVDIGPGTLWALLEAPLLLIARHRHIGAPPADARVWKWKK